MKIGVMGAGAIGCYVGGRLIASGADVVLVGRASVADDVAAHGMRLTDYLGADVKLPADRARIATDAGALADRDVVIVTVKSGATSSAGAELAGVLKADAVVVSLQNGVSNPKVLREVVKQRVLGAMVPFNVVRKDGGHFHRGTRGRVAVESAPHAGALVDALKRARMPAHAVADIDAVLWGKLVVNLNNSVNALAGVPIRTMIADRGYRRVMAACAREAIDVLAAAGIRPALEVPLPARVLPALLEMPNAIFLLFANAMVRADAEARSSMCDDLARGRKTEIDALNGEIVRLAHRVGRPSPVNAKIVELVHAAEGGASPMTAAELAFAIGSR